MRGPAVFPEDHELAGYRADAALDRVWVEVSLARRTQAHALRRRLPLEWQRCFVQPVDDHPSRTDTKFRFWIQDPEGADAVEGGLNALEAEFGFAVSPRIVGVEVAQDLFRVPGRHQKLDLAEAAFYMCKNLARPSEGEARITWTERWRGEKRSRFSLVADRREALAHLREHHTIRIGPRAAADSSRIYVKAHDHLGGEAYEALPVELHRARHERTLTEEHCPFTTFEEWRRFRFDKLTGLFTLRRHVPSERLPPSLRAKFLEVACSGRPVDEERHRKHKRTTPKNTRADEVAAEIFRGALRRLTTAQRAGRSRPAALTTVCLDRLPVGISGEESRPSRLVPEETDPRQIAGPEYIKDVPQSGTHPWPPQLHVPLLDQGLSRGPQSWTLPPATLNGDESTPLLACTSHCEPTPSPVPGDDRDALVPDACLDGDMLRPLSQLMIEINGGPLDDAELEQVLVASGVT